MLSLGLDWFCLTLNYCACMCWLTLWRWWLTQSSDGRLNVAVGLLPSACVSIHASVHPSMCPTINPAIQLPINTSAHPFIRPSQILSFDQSIYSFTQPLSIHPFIRPSEFHPSISKEICTGLFVHSYCTVPPPDFNILWHTLFLQYVLVSWMFESIIQLSIQLSVSPSVHLFFL